jgi:hypothetical protein
MKLLNKKGQGLSLNVIIVAALALIVLVVLVVVFTGRTRVFEEGVSKEGQVELIKMKISYGNCAPGAVLEEAFMTEFGSATTSEVKAQAKESYTKEISRCKDYSDDKTVCESNTGCVWK